MWFAITVSNAQAIVSSPHHHIRSTGLTLTDSNTLVEIIVNVFRDLGSLVRQLGEAETSLATMTHLSQGVAPIMTALGAAFPPCSGLIAVRKSLDFSSYYNV